MMELVRVRDMNNPELLEQLIATRTRVDQERFSTEKRLVEIRDYLKKIDDAIVAIRAANDRNLASGQDIAPPPKHRRKRNTVPPREIGVHARQFLVEAGKPMKRGALLRVFDAKGVPVTGGDRAKVLGTVLWRLRKDNGQPEFINTENGYWPADIPVPSGGT